MLGLVLESYFVLWKNYVSMWFYYICKILKFVYNDICKAKMNFQLNFAYLFTVLSEKFLVHAYLLLNLL